MVIMLSLLGASVILELVLLYTKSIWRYRSVAALPVLCVHGFAAGFVVWYGSVTLFGVLLGMLYLYRAGNVMRIVEQRMHEHYLQRAVRRTFCWLAGVQALVLLVWWLWTYLYVTAGVVWAALAVLQLLVAGVLFATTIRRMQHTAWPPAAPGHYSDAELPTLTVAVPARNETEDLQRCLESLTASNYPKLEVIVLDDCSQVRRTPEIIRGFAHDGVRFVKGAEPDATWLPKNQAYARLAGEATGEYILFCGVDIRFTPTALRDIVSTLLARKKQMMCILPERAPEVRSKYALAQVMRYIWELVPPRRLFKRPPVLSSCWIIEKDAFRRAGAFDAVRRSIVPEAHFARYAAATDAYSFMRAGKNPGVQSVKTAAAQRDTAERTRYPQLHRRPEDVVLLFFAEMVFLLLPFLLLLGGPWISLSTSVVIMTTVTCALLLATYMVVALGTKLGNGLLTLIMLPVVIVYDVFLLHRSMLRYEFSEVIWKGRNVCVPAMYVIPRLPKI